MTRHRRFNRRRTRAERGVRYCPVLSSAPTKLPGALVTWRIMDHKPVPPDYTVLQEPLTAKDCDQKGWLKGVVPVALSEIIDGDLETFMDKLSELLTGTELLSDFSYRVVGHDGDTLYIEVEGDAALCFDFDEVRG